MDEGRYAEAMEQYEHALKVDALRLDVPQVKRKLKEARDKLESGS
jgi:hypothetical protein